MAASGRTSAALSSQALRLDDKCPREKVLRRRPGEVRVCGTVAGGGLERVGDP